MVQGCHADYDLPVCGSAAAYCSPERSAPVRTAGVRGQAQGHTTAKLMPRNPCPWQPCASTLALFSQSRALCVPPHPQLPDTVVLWAPDQELLSPILLTRKNQNLFPPWVKHSSCPKLDQQQMGFKIRAVQEMVCEAMHWGKARLGEAAQSRFLPAFCIQTLFYLFLLCHSTTYIPLTLSCKSSL